MHSALTGVQVLVTSMPEHAHWLVHFCWGLHIGAAERVKATDIQMLVHWLLFCDNREHVFKFDYDTKKKEHQNTQQSDLYLATTPRTNQIASCFDALSITKKAF
jgi:hypothetical protein